MSKRAMMQSTQVMIAFQIEGDREQDLISLLQTIVQVALLLFGFWQWVSRLRREALALVEDCRKAGSLAASEVSKLLTLDFSFAFGVG